MAEQLARVTDELAALPPLVTSWEVEALKAQLARAQLEINIVLRHHPPKAHGQPLRLHHYLSHRRSPGVRAVRDAPCGGGAQS